MKRNNGYQSMFCVWVMCLAYGVNAGALGEEAHDHDHGPEPFGTDWTKGWRDLTITHKYERGLEFWFPFEDGNVYFKKLFGQFSHFYIIGKHSPGIR